MPLSHRARKRWSLVVLIVGMPLWIVAAVTVVGLFDRPPFWLEILVYVGLNRIPMNGRTEPPFHRSTNTRKITPSAGAAPAR
jgi:hypothetical protein